MYKWFTSFFKKEVKECNHIYFPVYEMTVLENGELLRQATGQHCSLCDDYNSAEDLGITLIK